MPEINMLTVLEQCQISPPPGSVGERSIRLSHFDLPFVIFPSLSQSLAFYKYPHSKTHFTQNVVPALKQSLSIALKHFFPFAANLVIETTKAELRYTEGDSVSLTIAESSNDFRYLIGNHPRNEDEFYPLLPRFGRNISRKVESEGSTTPSVPVLAVQVTLFPDHGICIGIANHHVVGDASSKVNFLKAWASITKYNGDETFIASGSLPFLDRTVIKDPGCVEAEAALLSILKGQEPPPQPNVSPISKVRASFVVSRAHIEKLKQRVSTQLPALAHISSFTVVCAYVWTCMAKLRAAAYIVVGIKEEEDEDELEKFICTADCRARLDPPVPKTYFGNCLAPCFASAKRFELLGEEGIVIAAQVIGDSIDKRVNNKEGILNGSELWFEQTLEMLPAVGVGGSPRFDVYEPDFGWGRAIKCENVKVEDEGSITFHLYKVSELDLGISFSLPKNQMEVFGNIFNNGLKAVNL